jgi:hypothetical protein
LKYKSKQYIRGIFRYSACGNSQDLIVLEKLPYMVSERDAQADKTPGEYIRRTPDC